MMPNRHPNGRWRERLALLLILVVAVPATTLAQRSRNDAEPYQKADLARLQATFSSIAKEVAPSVVGISTFREISRRGDTGRFPMSQGSGFVYRSNGLIVTNHHVIEGADAIEVTLSNGRKYEAYTIQFDPRSDLAVIKIDVPGMTAASLSDISKIQRGHWVFTAGNPFGLAESDGDNSVSFGVVSAIGKNLFGRIETADMDRYYGNLIQTDAVILPGNSGGPLFNLNGEVVGICAAMEPGSGIRRGVGFAIPIEPRTRRILDMLASGQIVRYGYLGVTVVPLSGRRLSDVREAGVPTETGAYVVSLDDHSGDPSPAEQAGLAQDDVIVEFDGERIQDSDHLVRLVGSLPIGEPIPVVYYRGEQRRETKVTLAERASTVAARRRAIGASGLRFLVWRGAVLVEATDAFLRAKELNNENVGLYVAEVEKDSSLARNGLAPDSMIVQYDGRRVRTIEDFSTADNDARGERTIKLQMRDGRTLTVPNQ